MAKLLLSVTRLGIIGLNLGLLSFHPNTELEISIFFAARSVFFLMLVIDYIQVAYYNTGVERFVGFIGVLISLGFALIEISGYLNFFAFGNYRIWVYYGW